MISFFIVQLNKVKKHSTLARVRDCFAYFNSSLTGLVLKSVEASKNWGADALCPIFGAFKTK